MRVVLGTHSFARTGGTESYVFTVARELQRLGHETIVAAEEFGPMTDFAEQSGIPVARTSDSLPPQCDVVFAQDAIMAAILAERYPGIRMVFFAHSDLHDHQLPPLLPDLVSTVVVASDRVEARIRALAANLPIVRLRHPIDTERFAPAPPISPKPQRALLLGNYLHGERLHAVIDAWESAGVECVQVGAANPELDPVPAIAAADIVVGKARAALEGMSCARAVYVYDHFGGDGWVTPDNYAALEADNFAGQATPRARTAHDLATDLAGYRADMGRVNHELIRTHHSARKHASRLVQVLNGNGNVSTHDATPLGEVARLARSNLYAERQVVAWRGRALEAERQLATRRVRAGLALGRAVDRVLRR